MNKQSKYLMTVQLLLLLTTIVHAQSLQHYITKKGDGLYDGQKLFRFVGVNVPDINGHYDGYRNTGPESGYVYDPTELTYEMESHFINMAQMGVTVFRTWGITVFNGSTEYESLVKDANAYNETAFRRIDKMLQLCYRYGIRAILCLVKENPYWGGTAAFSKLHGGGDYYTTPAVKEGFKKLLDSFANRKNYYTGVRYKEDKAILAWEFGNEVPNKEVAWIDEMSTYLKGIAPNQLIVDPRRANGVDQLTTLVNDVLQRCKNIDFVKTRQYPNYQGTVDQLWAVCEGRLPLIVDEFQQMAPFEDILKRVDRSGVSGAMLWSLMKYQYNGGLGGHALFHSYGWGGSRWPGFNSGAYFNEEKNLHLIREYAYKIRGESVPPLPLPAGKPVLFKTLYEDAAALKWRCTPGARYYVVERSTSKSGPWTNVSGDVDVSFDLYFYPMFTDSSATIGATYYYRVRGKNASGITGPSNSIGPIKIKQRMVVDNLLDSSKIYTKSTNLVINKEAWPRLRQTEEDFAQLVRTPGSGAGEIIYKAKGLKSVTVVLFNNTPDSLLIEFSTDGLTWRSPIQPINRTVRKGYASAYSGQKDNPVDKYTYEVKSLPAGTQYVRLTTANSSAADSFPWIGRVHLGLTGQLIPSK